MQQGLHLIGHGERVPRLGRGVSRIDFPGPRASPIGTHSPRLRCMGLFSHAPLRGNFVTPGGSQIFSGSGHEAKKGEAAE